MMLRHRLECELLDELVLSERSATAGAHRSLDHLPGAAFLGAVAARLYAKLAPADAFTVFHSGKVRFCNAQPADNGRVARPVPLSLHERKSDPAGDPQLDAGRLYNFVQPAAREACRSGGGQPRQLRSAWLTEDGRLIRPARAWRMKTAVDAATGRAAEGILFGYESLLPGTRFVGELQFDADVSAALREAVLQTVQGTLRLGRSRSAQYGRVRCSVTAVPTQGGAPAGDCRLVLWLLSDLAASCDGVPTFSPCLHDLGLKAAARLDPESTFLRTRAYAPYNAHRRLPDLERQLIVAGSVLVYELDAPLDADDLAMLAAGLGDGRECGLGQVAVHPALLAGEHPVFSNALAGKAQAVTMPDHPLLHWLSGEDAARSEDERLAAWVEAAVRQWRQRQESARCFGGLADFAVAGPSPTQWGMVQEAGKQARGDRARLRKTLFAADAGICRGEEDWERPLGPGWQQPTLREWLEAELNGLDAARNAGLAVARLAAAIQKSLSGNRQEPRNKERVDVD